MIGKLESAHGGKAFEPRPGAADVVPIVYSHAHRNTRHMVEHLLTRHAQPFAESHHAAVVSIVNRWIVYFLHVHVAYHIRPWFNVRTIPDHVPKPTRKMRGEISMLGGKNPRALNAQMLIHKLKNLRRLFPPGICYRL